MKKTVLFILALLLVCAAGCALASGQTTTLLVYICGSELEDAACEDLAEMAEVEAGDAVNMVVLAGGSASWPLEDLKGNTRTLAVIRNGYFEKLEDWGHASMGDPESLREFLVYGLTEYPADRTIVILWNHGSGSEGGMCSDITAGDDWLSIVEIDEALGQVQRSVPGFHINIFGCDACMMATYEMAVMLSRHDIGYFVASEELEPGTGWYYTAFLRTLADDPSISDADLCRVIVDSYLEEGLANDPDDYLTLSAVSLAEIGPLEASMEKFASVMAGEIRGGNFSAVRRGRSRMYTFGSFADGSWDMVDLGAALDAYAQFDPDSAAEAKRCLSRAVIARVQSDNLDPCSGLSVLIPQDTTEDFDDFREGFDLSAVIPNWMDFLYGYVGMLRDGHYHFSISDTTQITPDSWQDEDELFIPATAFPSGAMIWDDDDECYAEEPSAAEEITVSDSSQGFTAVIPVEDLPYLDYVEGMLLMNISEGEGESYVELGVMRNNLVDWKSGRVCSLFDGSWPLFGGQLVPLYDQTSNENSRRSLIPVKLNGEYTYLVVVFPAGGTEGRVIGANAGYGEGGLPIRNTTRLQEGDVIVPVYTMYYEEEGKDDLQEAEFDGEEIVWHEGMTVTYGDLADEDEPTEMVFCFLFNDVFGESTMSEMISFEL